MGTSAVSAWHLLAMDRSCYARLFVHPELFWLPVASPLPFHFFRIVLLVNVGIRFGLELFIFWILFSLGRRPSLCLGSSVEKPS